MLRSHFAFWVFFSVATNVLGDCAANTVGNCDGPKFQFPSQHKITPGRYVSSDMGIAFEYPSNWKVKDCLKPKTAPRPDSKCIVLSTALKRGEPQIQIEVIPQSFDSVLASSDGRFSWTDEEIWITGNAGMNRAVRFKNKNRFGVYGSATCAIDTDESKDGHFHAAGGECLSAIISNGRKSAVIETFGLVNPDIVAKKIVGSFTFRD
jgi:hypothetical protein